MKKISKYLYACLPLLMVLAVFFLVPNLFALMQILFPGAFLFRLLGPAGNPNSPDYLNLISTIMYTCALIPVTCWYFFGIYQKRSSKRRGSFGPSTVGPVVFLALGVSHSLTLLFMIMSIFIPDALNSYNNLIEDSGMLNYSVLWFVSTIILPPLVEELTFRGITMHLFQKAGAPFWIANILQALLFGVFHMNLVQGIYAFFLGILLGYLVKRYNSLIASMTFHAFFNFFGTWLSDLESRYFDDYLNFLAMIVGIILTVYALYRIKKTTRPRSGNWG